MVFNRTSREQRTSCPALPETAIPGGFALVIDHFISEMTDCTQQQKNAFFRRPFPVRFPPALFSFPPRYGACKEWVLLAYIKKRQPVAKSCMANCRYLAVGCPNFNVVCYKRIMIVREV